MQNIMNVEENVKKLRNQLDKMLETFGVKTPEVISLSRKLDKEILALQKLRLGYKNKSQL